MKTEYLDIGAGGVDCSTGSRKEKEQGRKN
jgi:hypothetical protein